MCRASFLAVRAAVCTGLFVIGLHAQATTIVAGSGAKPPTLATGIYEVAVATTSDGQVQKALALVHKGALKEVHSRSARGYQRRGSGSTAIRVPTSAYDKLLALAGGTNRDVNGMPVATRCKFYALAGIPTTGMACPTSTSGPATVPPTNGTCPPGYTLKLMMVDGRKQLRCALMTRA